MPVIAFNKKYLYELLGAGIDDDKLREQVMKLGFEVESIDADSVSVELTANRLDLLDAVGFARTFRNFMHRSKKFHYQIEEETPTLQIVVDKNVRRVRPYVAGLLAENVKLSDESLANLINFTEKFCETYGRGRKRVAIGMHNLDAIKPPVVYKCENDIEYVPLGSDKMTRLSKVLEESEKGRQYSGILTKSRGAAYPVIMDKDGVAAFVPILNSERTKVTTATTNIFIDITGTSEYAVGKTADLLAATFIDLGANVRRVRILYDQVKVDTPQLEKRYLILPLSRAEREIGVKIGYNNVISLANKMGYEAGLLGNDIQFRVPEYRLDIIDLQDVVEDLAIAYGYEYIAPLPIYYSQQGGLEDITKTGRRVAEIMVGLGFSEFTNTYLTNESTNFESMGVQGERNVVLLKNSKTETITMLRTWILPSLLKNIGASAHEKMPQDAFELDLVFSVKEGKAVESHHLGAVSVNPRINFNDMKAVVEGLLSAIGVPYQISEYRHRSFIEGRCAEIKISNRFVGYFGELHPKVLKNFGIEEAVVAFEIDVNMLSTKS